MITQGPAVAIMSSMRPLPRHLQCLQIASKLQWRPVVYIRSSFPSQRRPMSTEQIPPSRDDTSPTPPMFTSTSDPSILEDQGRFDEGSRSGMGPPGDGRPTSRQARVVPFSPSYFSRHPYFNDRLVHLEKLLVKVETMPTVPASQQRRAAWHSLESYRISSGEDVKATQFGVAMRLLTRLYAISPHIRPKEVDEALAPFQRDYNREDVVVKPIPVDEWGRAIGVGRRKRSVARAWVVEGTGEVQINGKSLVDAFARIHDRESAIWGLRVTERMDKYNVWALVEGGGTTGQAEAVAMAIAKGLMGHEPELKPALRRAGCITRDPREVERKKTGHLKARKKPAWVKR